VFYEHVNDQVWINDDFYAFYVRIGELPWPYEDLYVFYEHLNDHLWTDDDFYACVYW
jgi:hypothetical protein